MSRTCLPRVQRVYFLYVTCTRCNYMDAIYSSYIQLPRCSWMDAIYPLYSLLQRCSPARCKRGMFIRDLLRAIHQAVYAFCRTQGLCGIRETLNMNYIMAVFPSYLLNDIRRLITPIYDGVYYLFLRRHMTWYMAYIFTSNMPCIFFSGSRLPRGIAAKKYGMKNQWQLFLALGFCIYSFPGKQQSK